jgi:hypothetical protein
MINQEKRYLVLVLSLLLIGMSSSPAQDPIGVQSILAPVSTLTINDVDFINSTTPKWLFTVVLTPQGTVPVQVSLRIRIAVSFTDDGSFSQAALYTSPPFELAGIRTLTNLDLREPELRAPVQLNQQVRQRFQDAGLPSGLLPAGSYEFVAEVTTVDGLTVLGSDDDRLVLTNPSTVELLLPSEGEAVSTPFPLFQWRGDASSWHIAVYQRLPGQAGPEETVAGVPHLTADATTQSFQYPAAGARVLETGKTYVWYVEGVEPATGGVPRTFRSPLRSFTVSTGSAGLSPSLLDELERALGPRYQGVIDQLRAEGFSPSGTMRLNGSPISTTELMNILGVLRGNPDAVTSVVIE